MYLITELSGAQKYYDRVALVRLAANGCYVAAEPETAGGFAASGGGEPAKVFQFAEGSLKGSEPIGSYEETEGAGVISELDSALEEAYELLYGGEDA